ncbi:MAG: nitrogenase molybdenum-iron protein subunit beta [Coriobacteriaceae bacterium]|jgi:nitrogenase molybdenum-iron protein beta chain|nr:nitrogenase molybdenum-iron protein subunit beta [Coriobacteriaceae bacterium]
MLDLTPSEHLDRRALRINPCKTCQPVGALFAALGVERCMPHSHGSQGCCSYHRTVLSRHFKEPAIAASSSFTEGASVFGGRSNLVAATRNIFAIYDPDIIAVHTTCLSETIGDDLGSYIMDLEVPPGKLVVHANTPSYAGSHIVGYARMTMGFMSYLTQKTGVPNGRCAVLPGWVNPGDLRELKQIAAQMEVPCTFFPDQSGVLDAPMTGTYELYPKGGTTIAEIRGLGDSESAIALGEIINEEPAELLEKKWKVPYTLLPLPVGVAYTDAFVMALQRHSKLEVPADLEAQRGRLVDLLLDSHQYTYGKRVALFGDPDIVLALTSLVLEAGMVPAYVITGTPKETFTRKAEALFAQYGAEGCIARAGSDLFELHQWIKRESVDLLIGSSYGKQIARAEDIPFVRAGFPVLDRYGHSLLPVVGYTGGIRLIEKISNALMDRFDRDCAEEDFEVVM